MPQRFPKTQVRDGLTEPCEKPLSQAELQRSAKTTDYCNSYQNQFGAHKTAREMCNERQSSVYHSLGKFKISPSGIENLAKAIAAEGSERFLTLSSIDITTKHSTFTYDTVEELRSNRVWEKSINKFSIHFREVEKYGENESRAISIRGGGGGENYISVRGDEESWVVGMGNIVRDMIRKHEVWYRHLAAWGLVHMVYPMNLNPAVG